MSPAARSMPLLAPSLTCPRAASQWQQPFLKASFSTSTSRPAAVVRPGKVVHKRGVKASRGQRSRKPQETAKRPSEELKAWRKRIVLSNVNALEVSDLKDLERDTQLTQELRGTMLGLPGPLVDQLRAIEAFQPRQSWGMFKRPAVVVTEAAVEMARTIDRAGKAGQAERRVLVGDRGSGKSVLLLQAMAMALLKEWVVISIPEAMYLVNAHTAYSPIQGTSPPRYSQKAYTAALLQRIVRANPVLATLKPADPKKFPTYNLISQNNLNNVTLADLVDRAAGGDMELAWPTFEALWSELAAPGRPPLLLSLDGLSKIMQLSEYRSAEYEPVHAHDLALVSWFVELLSGKTALPNGGLVLAATSRCNTPANKTLDLQLARLEAQQAQAAGRLKYDPAADPIAPFLAATGLVSDPFPKFDPFYTYDARVLEALEGAASAPGSANKEPSATAQPPHVQRVGSLSTEEARGLMEYWARSGMVRARVDDQLVRQKWTLAGGGVLGELEKGCFKMRI